VVCNFVWWPTENCMVFGVLTWSQKCPIFFWVEVDLSARQRWPSWALAPKRGRQIEDVLHIVADRKSNASTNQDEQGDYHHISRAMHQSKRSPRCQMLARRLDSGRGDELRAIQEHCCERAYSAIEQLERSISRSIRVWVGAALLPNLWNV
jgi:hypothetical protein